MVYNKYKQRNNYHMNWISKSGHTDSIDIEKE